MRSSSTERGLSEVLGAILMFALVFAVLVIIQVWAVPTANAQIELQHSQAVEGDYGQLAASLDRVSSLGVSETVSLEGGVRYPSRLFLINPAPASYTFASTDGQRISLSGVDADDEDARDYLNVGDDPMDFATVSYTYTPSYNIYAEAPSFHVENGLVYKQFPNGEIVFINEPDIIDGRRISLTVFEGSFSEGGADTLELEVNPISAGREYTSVQATGTPVLRFYTSLSVDTWSDLLLDGSQPNVLSVSCSDASVDDADPCNDELEVTLKSGVTYDLRVSKLAIGEASPTDTPAYVTKVGQEKPTISPDGTEFVVKVHDEYNNPLSNQEVTFQVVDGAGTISRVDDTTDRNGLVSTVYTPVGNAAVTIAAGLDTDGDNKVDDEIARRYVQYTGLTVNPGNLDEGPQFDINSAEPGSVVLSYTKLTPEGCNNGCDAILGFENTGSDSQTVESMRINYYSPNAISRGNGNSFPGVPATVTVTGSTGTETIGVQGAFNPVTVATFDAGETEDLTFAFENADGSDFDLYEGDFFMFTLIYTDGGSNIYIAAPTDGNNPPVASFTGPSDLQTGESGSFNAGSSTDGDGNIVSYTWDFGDGTTATGETVSHTYSDTGSWTVELTVIDDDGDAGVATETVSVTSGGGPGDVTGATASELSGGDSQAQSFTFTLGNDLSVGDTVTVDLNAAQGNGGQDVDYRSATVDPTATGSATFTTQSRDNAVITYTADGTETAGTTVTVDISGADPGNSASGPYTVTVTGPDGTDVTTTFSVA